MSSQEEKILKIVPAIRMIMSQNSLKSGSFVPLDQLIDTDPESISVRLGRSISVFKGDVAKVIKEVEKGKDEVGQYIFIDDLGDCNIIEIKFIKDNTFKLCKLIFG